MKYKRGFFNIENVDIKNISKKVGTPSYIYSYKMIKNNINNFKKNFKLINPLICFSVKSNANTKILNIMGKSGLGADVVSGGELVKALKAGISPKKIVFSGIGKTPLELEMAIKKKILLINVESDSEIVEIEKIAKNLKLKIKIGIRLNPDTDAKTLSKISTGKKENKFGINKKLFLKIIKKYKNSKFVNICCVSVHIGSQILSNAPYEKMLKVTKRLIRQSNHKFEYIDLGGGMGIQYDIKDKKFNYRKYCNSIIKIFDCNKTKIIFEPGRSIIGNAGVLISKVIYLKETKNKNFVVMDAAMNDFMRPALYGAKHRIIPYIKGIKNLVKKHEFVGPICETSDKFLSSSKFKKLKQKEILIILDTGAYGMTLASNYNLRPLPAEVLVNGNKFKIIKNRQKLSDII